MMVEVELLNTPSYNDSSAHSNPTRVFLMHEWTNVHKVTFSLVKIPRNNEQPVEMAPCSKQTQNTMVRAKNWVRLERVLRG